MDIHQLEKVRPLGKLESISSVCHHLGFYNNVGLSAHYKLSQPVHVSEIHHLIYTAVTDVIRKHPILSAIPVDEHTPEPYFARLPSIDLKKSISFVKRNQPIPVNDEGEDSELDALLEDQHNADFKSDYGTLPFWRLIVLQNPGVENEFTACFIFHHAIGDGVSGLVFLNSFRDALAATTSLSLQLETEHIIVPNNSSLLPPIEELHPLPLPETPSQPTSKIVNEWRGNVIQLPCKSHFKSLSLSPNRSKSFIQECKKNNVSVTATLPSLIATTLYDILPLTTEALTCIIPVSLRPWLPRHIVDGAIGTWFDAFKVQIVRPDKTLENSNASSNPTEIWPQAQEVSKAIRKYLTASPSGEPYTTIAIFKSIPDVAPIFASTVGKERDAAFELSNLGFFSSPITDPTPSIAGDKSVWKVGKLIFSRSAVVSGTAITIGVVSGGDGGMTLGFTWQEGVVEETFVDKVISSIKMYFAALG
ncbi:hypothetical protein CC78DRAFT_561551 [Lojkania enalia]|uniref:Alcohol acetyltransferase n=1 Tax=Lojkania enalia TaxID=147567 RepID=A0A9P4K3G2_9PLEO|nr:hypothetical protein CC78DRAFT_561551 [Didymosphaeria enalia]